MKRSETEIAIVTTKGSTFATANQILAWKEKAEKFDKLSTETVGFIKAFSWLNKNEIEKIPDHPDNDKNREIVTKLREYYESGEGILNDSPRDLFAEIHEMLGGDSRIPEWALDEWKDLRDKK